jgi:hypothetical protein
MRELLYHRKHIKVASQYYGILPLLRSSSNLWGRFHEASAAVLNILCHACGDVLAQKRTRNDTTLSQAAQRRLAGAESG